MDPHRQLNDDQQHQAAESLRAGLAMGGIDVDELWADAIALGGMLAPPDVAAAVAGERRCTAHEHDLMAQALNDRFTARGQNHPVRYSFELA